MSLKFAASNNDTLRIEFGHQNPKECVVMLPFVDKKGKLELQKPFKLARKCYGRIVKLTPGPDGKNLRTKLVEAAVDCHPNDNYEKEQGRQKVLLKLEQEMRDKNMYVADIDKMWDTYDNRPRLAQPPKEGVV